MKKKLGPLQTYQWLAIGLAAGVLYYIYKARQANAAAASTGASPAQASDTTSLGPVDPTTGQPYALEALGNNSNGTNAQNSGPTSLAQELSDLGLIETLMANIGQLIPTGPQTPSGTTGAGAVSTATGQATVPVAAFKWDQLPKRLKDELQGLEHAVHGLAPKATIGGIVHGGTVNPGHTVTTHGGGIVHGGKQTASSSAPQNSQQHKNIQPPNHQKHPTHPTGGAGY